MHVNGICLQLLQGSSGLDDSLLAAVVGIAAAVYRSNCETPHPLPPPAFLLTQLDTPPPPPPQAAPLHCTASA